MSYEVFRDKNNITEDQKSEHLETVVKHIVDSVIAECGKHVQNYEHNKNIGFPGVNGMLSLIDDNIFNKVVMESLKEKAVRFGVSRPQSLLNYEVIYGTAYNPDDEKEVLNNIDKMRDEILQISSDYKESAIKKFDFSEQKKHTNDLSFANLLPRMEACLKDSTYKVLSGEEKIEFKMKYLTGEYPEASIKDFVEKTYKEDLNDQLRCAKEIQYHNVNESKYAIHSDFKDLLDHTEDDVHNQKESYGLKLTQTGLKLFNIKKEFAEKVLENFDDNFEIFYASVSKHVRPHIEDVSKLSMIDKLKNVAFGNNVDVDMIIKQNQHSDIKSIIEEKNRNKLKM